MSFREYAKGIEDKMDHSHVLLVDWLEDKDNEIEALTKRLDAQEKELAELRTCLAGTEQVVPAQKGE